MFTGIVEEMGVLKSIRKGAHSAILEIQAKVVLEDIHLGDSIAVNGVCLTATSFSPTGFTADVMHETLNRSSLASLRPGHRVNLERAMAANGRFGGHIVAGHVDGVGTVQRIEKDDNAIWYTIAAGPEWSSSMWWKKAPSLSTASASPWPVWTARALPSPPSPTPFPSRSWPTGSPATL